MNGAWALATALLGLAGRLSGAEIEIPFEVDAGSSAILVRGAVDGRPALFVLDTGASRTIVDAALLGSRSALAPSGFSGDGPGLRARGRHTEATLALGGRAWKRRGVVAMNLTEVSEAFGRRIDGLIGQDLLCEFERVTIDFRSRTLRLE
jgi:hypothetical protein